MEVTDLPGVTVIQATVPAQDIAIQPIPAAASSTTTAEQDRQTAGERLALRTAAPTTTEEQERVSAGQRAVNLMWESTQRDIARWVIGSALIVASAIAILGQFIGSPELQLAAVVFIFGVANLVTGFYFGRTNHQRTGGVGQAETGSTR